MGHEQHAAGGLRRGAHEVRGDEHAPAVAPVGDHAAREGEDEEGHELGGHDEADGADAAARLEHREGQGHEHHPVADHRQDLAEEEQAELRLGAEDLGNDGPARHAQMVPDGLS